MKDGRIVEVGGTDEILWLREDDYELIDLEGRTVVPGTRTRISRFRFEAPWRPASVPISWSSPTIR